MHEFLATSAVDLGFERFSVALASVPLVPWCRRPGLSDFDVRAFEFSDLTALHFLALLSPALGALISAPALGLNSLELWSQHGLGFNSLGSFGPSQWGLSHSLGCFASTALGALPSAPLDLHVSFADFSEFASLLALSPEAGPAAAKGFDGFFEAGRSGSQADLGAVWRWFASRQPLDRWSLGIGPFAWLSPDRRALASGALVSL